AADWALTEMRKWGLQNAHLEPWAFGHPGWSNERFSAHITAPVADALVGEVLAWTPSTTGTATGAAVRIEPPQCRPGAANRESCPTREELAVFLDGARDRVTGRMVLVGPHEKVSVTFAPETLRRPDEQVRRQYDLENPAASPFANRQAPEREPGRLSRNEINEEIDRFLLAGGALLRINDAARDHGQVRAFNNRTFDPAKTVPTVILRNEDYGRISRMLDSKIGVEIEIAIVNRIHPEGRTSYNAIAEIPGGDKRHEVVMLGAHLDSWHAATGATDNGIGSAIMMEAARILAAIGVRPRRTIRVALWSGEEQGLLGSKAYVKEHFGTFEQPKPEFHTFNGYFNIDSGTGRIRGASIFGPKAAGAVLRDAFAAFEDFGIVGASTTRSRRSGGTDSTSFNEAGLPGIGLGQDPIQYRSHTWHTNLDTYERIVEEDVVRAAIAIAGVVYHVAMREAMLPRFSTAEMPEPARPAQRPTSTPSSSGVRDLRW
ncbi:MAG: M20/M25/M40 family metallo-hydrolase, partial [Vicinamibacterales bacterium]